MASNCILNAYPWNVGVSSGSANDLQEHRNEKSSFTRAVAAYRGLIAFKSVELD